MADIPRLRTEEPWNSPNVDTWKERIRSQVLENKARITTSFVGLYDQVADQVAPTSVPLDVATNYAPGDYYTLSTTGVFSTAIPELNGLTGGPGDQVISDGTVWLLLEYSGAFLSSVSDDTAAGVVTFTPAPKTPATPVVGDDITRKGYVDSGDAANDAALAVHVSHNLTTPTDPHGIQAHAGETASADDVHGTKTYTDAQDAAHVAAADPHTQYMLETDALAIFAFAAYGGMVTDPAAPATIGLAWSTVPWSALSITTPRGLTFDVASDSFVIENDGVYEIALTGSFGHNESNGARDCLLRFYNVTDATASPTEFRVFTGRNQAGSPVAWVFQVEVTEALKGKSWRLEVGGTADTYSTVDWQGELAIKNIGEWREPLPSDTP